MSHKAFEAIKAGLEDAIAYAEGDKSRGVEHRVQVPIPNVRALRNKLGMTQEEFADTFGVSAGTVRNWEQGRRTPEGAARVLMRVIALEPDAVKRALAG